MKNYWERKDSLVVEDALLKRVLESPDSKQYRKQIVVPKSKVPEVLREYHGVSSIELRKSFIGRDTMAMYRVGAEDIKSALRGKCQRCVFEGR